MEESSNHSPIFHKPLSYFLLAILISDLIVGGILLPRHQAQAFCTPGIDIAMFSLDKVKWAWDKVTWAYQKAADAIQSGVASWQKSENILVKTTKAAWMVLRKQMLNMLVDDTIKWIQGTGGKPRLVTDWKKFLYDAANKAGGDFIKDYLQFGFLCQPLKLQLRFALQKSDISFEEQTRCTLDQIVANVQNFYNDFNEGGWQAWARISDVQNNYYGAYLFAMDRKMAEQSANKEASLSEAISSSGFLGDKVCLERKCVSKYGETVWFDTHSPSDLGWANGDEKKVDPSLISSAPIYLGATCSCAPGKWETRTPGKILADSASKAVTLDIDWLISANEFNEYLGAILDAVVNRVTREGLAKMGVSNAYRPQGSQPSIKISPGVYTDTTEGQNLTASLIKELRRLEVNLATVGDQYEANLKFLEEIKYRQDITLRALGWIVKNGCSSFAGILASKDNGLAEIWDITNSLNPYLREKFPPCLSETPAEQHLIKIKLDNVGEIVVSSVAGGGTEIICSTEITSIKTEIDSFKKGEVLTLHKILDRPDLSGGGKGLNLIEGQRTAVETAAAAAEQYKTAEDYYVQKNLEYLKINPANETGQKKWNLDLNLGAYAPEVEDSLSSPNVTNLETAKKEVYLIMGDSASDSEVLALAQKMLTKKFLDDVGTTKDPDGLILAALLINDPAVPTAEIKALAETLVKVKQEQDAQKIAEEAKEALDLSFNVATSSAVAAIKLLDVENLSVASSTGNADLNQIYREIQGFSSEIADQAGSLETERGISQKDPLKPIIKCDADQIQSTKSLLGYLCNVTNNLLIPIGAVFLQKIQVGYSYHESNPEKEGLANELRNEKTGRIRLLPNLGWLFFEAVDLKVENTRTKCPEGPGIYPPTKY